MPPIIFPENRPPEDAPFESRYTKARQLGSLGPPKAALEAQIEYIDPTPSAKAMEKQVKTKLSAIDLQRQIDEMGRRPASAWDGFPSFAMAMGALIMLALAALYVLATTTPQSDHPAPAESECELEYSPHLPLPFRYYPSCD